MSEHKIINEFKFSKSQALFTILLPFSLYEPFQKMIWQAIRFHEYYWFLLMLFIIQLLYRVFFKTTLLMMTGVPAIILTKEDITMTERGFTIEWRDIEEMNLVVTQGKGRSFYVDIEVNDPWKYISQVKNPVIRYYRWYALDYVKPFKINLSVVEGDSYAVYDTIERCFHSYRRAGDGA